MNTKFKLSCICVCVCVSVAQAQSTWYVDASSTCTSSCGQSWQAAFPRLQQALIPDNSGDLIKVAGGTYKPSDCVTCTGADRNDSFELVDGVTLEGGYAGYGASDPDARGAAADESVLTGELATGVYSYHVVSGGAGIEDDTVLDGFTIKKGRADGGSADLRLGAGIYLIGYVNGNPPTPSASPTIRNCTIEYNLADAPQGQGDHGSGGGAYCDQLSTAIFENCTFQNNQAHNQGGAVFTNRAAPSFTDCRFIANVAFGITDHDDGFGGAVAIGTQPYFEVDVEFLRCVFRHNEATKDGGAIYTNDSTSGNLVMTNCLLYRNTAGANTTSTQGKGGAIYTTRLTYLTNCTLSQNWAYDANGGGGIYHTVQSELGSAMDNCILWKNSADSDDTHEADQIVVFQEGESFAEMLVLNTCIEDRDPNGQFNDPTNISTDPLFTSLANDQYVLLSTGCSGEDCDSDAIDEGDNNEIDCNGGDLVLNDRCVELEGIDAINDMGCLETQE